MTPTADTRAAPASVRWDVFGVASIAVFLVSVDTTVLFAAFAALRAGFPGSTASELSWVLNAYTLVYAALLVPAGRLVDARGRKQVFQAGLLLFLGVSAACGAAAPIDLPGIALLIVGVGALANGVVRFDGGNWREASVLGSVLLGVAGLLAFIAWARRKPHPAVDLALFADRNYRLVNLATLLFGMAFSLMFFGYFFFLTQVWHYTLPQAGLAVTPGPLLVVPSAVVSGRIAARLGHRLLLSLGCVLYAAGGLWLLTHLGSTPDYLRAWLPGLLMTGVAVGMVLPSLSSAAVARLAPARFGVGSAVNQAIRQVGSVLGVAVTVALVGQVNPGLPDFQHLFATHIVLAVLCALLTAGVDTRPIAR